MVKTFRPDAEENTGYADERTRRKGKRITFIISIFIFIIYHVIVEIDNQILTKKNSIDHIYFSSLVEKDN